MTPAGPAPYLGVSETVDGNVTADLREHLQATLGASYTIERELGGGGMSRVFLAHETSLGRSVVVKLLPPDLGAGVDAERFRREVRLAAQLQHPHIVPLLSAGERDGLLYYTMPYVAGESLRALIDRSGELPVAGALRLLRDIADALAYAHRQGVVHRDLKPANVLLEEGHAVVIDFGVAKALSAAANAHALTAAGIALGTPAYMAPEQAAAEPTADHRADLYAFGILAYEMLAGQPPFAGRNATQLLAAHLTVAPEPLTARRPGVSPELAALVMRCLEKRPADRPQSADEVIRALDTMPTRPVGTPGLEPRAGAAGAASVRSRLPGRRAMLVTGLTVAALAVTVVVEVGRRRGTARLVERRVLVVPLDNETGDSTLAPIGRLAAEWTTQGLAEVGILEVVDARTAEQALAAVDRSTTRADLIRRLARATRARTVVSGAYYREGDTLRLHTEITDASQGRLMRALSPVSGPVASPSQAITLLRQRILGAVSTLLDPRAAPWTPPSGEPPSLEAYRQWTSGLELFRRGEFAASVPRFLEAGRRDSTFYTPVLWAAAAHGNMGQLAVADSLLRAVALSRERLVLTDRYLLDYWVAVLRGDLAAALDAARGSARMRPGAAGAALLYGGAALTANRPREAVTAFTSPDVSVASIGSYPPFWEQLAFAHHLLGEYQQELEVARRGRRQYPQDLSLLEPEIRSLAALGRTEDVMRRLNESLVLPPSAFLTPGQLMERCARELLAHGKVEMARSVSARAAAWYAKAGPDSAAAQLLAQARAMYTAGRYEDAAAAVAAIPGGARRPDVIGYHGTVAARRGDRRAALAADSALAALADPYLGGANTLWRARIAAVLGERGRAVALLRKAFADGRAVPWLHGDPDFLALRDDPSFRELMRPKG